MTQNRLQNLRIVLARAEREISVLKADLVRRGAEVIELPAMQIEDVEGWGSTVFAKKAPDWTIVYNKGAAQRLARVLRQGKGRHEQLGKIAAVGRNTSQYLEKYGLWPQRSCETQKVQELVDALVARGVKNARIQIIGPDPVPTAISTALEDAGAEVRVVPVYRATFSDGSVDAIEKNRDLLPDLIVFPSLSTVTHFAALLDERDVQSWANVPAAAIGPTTASAASEYGYRVETVPEVQTMGALSDAIERWHTVH